MSQSDVPNSPAPRVAVINDDAALLSLIDIILTEEAGCEVVTFRAWEDAFEKTRELQPDLIILDIRMGNREVGWELLELFLLDPLTRHTPILVCTAAAQALEQRREQLLRYGIAVLPKPFNVDDLLNAVHEKLAPRTGDGA